MFPPWVHPGHRSAHSISLSHALALSLSRPFSHTHARARLPHRPPPPSPTHPSVALFCRGQMKTYPICTEACMSRRCCRRFHCCNAPNDPRASRIVCCRIVCCTRAVRGPTLPLACLGVQIFLPAARPRLRPRTPPGRRGSSRPGTRWSPLLLTPTRLHAGGTKQQHAHELERERDTAERERHRDRQTELRHYTTHEVISGRDPGPQPHRVAASATKPAHNCTPPPLSLSLSLFLSRSLSLSVVNTVHLCVCVHLSGDGDRWPRVFGAAAPVAPRGRHGIHPALCSATTSARE